VRLEADSSPLQGVPSDQQAPFKPGAVCFLMSRCGEHNHQGPDPGLAHQEQLMNITTTLITRRPARASLAFAIATTVLLGASACGSEHASDQDQPKAVPTHRTYDRSPADTSEELVDGARKWHTAGTQDGDRQESPVLPPDGRPVPLPGQTE
jgi:hypothetical protein